MPNFSQGIYLDPSRTPSCCHYPQVFLMGFSCIITLFLVFLLRDCSSELISGGGVLKDLLTEPLEMVDTLGVQDRQD